MLLLMVVCAVMAGASAQAISAIALDPIRPCVTLGAFVDVANFSLEGSAATIRAASFEAVTYNVTRVIPAPPIWTFLTDPVFVWYFMGFDDKLPQHGGSWVFTPGQTANLSWIKPYGIISGDSYAVALSSSPNVCSFTGLPARLCMKWNFMMAPDPPAPLGVPDACISQPGYEYCALANKSKAYGLYFYNISGDDYLRKLAYFVENQCWYGADFQLSGLLPCVDLYEEIRDGNYGAVKVPHFAAVRPGELYADASVGLVAVNNSLVSSPNCMFLQTPTCGQTVHMVENYKKGIWIEDVISSYTYGVVMQFATDRSFMIRTYNYSQVNYTVAEAQVQGLFDFVGDIASGLFGLATERDLSGLYDGVAAALKGVAENSRLIGELSKELIAFRQLVDSQFRQLLDMINDLKLAVEIASSQASHNIKVSHQISEDSVASVTSAFNALKKFTELAISALASQVHDNTVASVLRQGAIEVNDPFLSQVFKMMHKALGDNPDLAKYGLGIDGNATSPLQVLAGSRKRLLTVASGAVMVYSIMACEKNKSSLRSVYKVTATIPKFTRLMSGPVVSFGARDNGAAQGVCLVQGTPDDPTNSLAMPLVGVVDQMDLTKALDEQGLSYEGLESLSSPVPFSQCLELVSGLVPYGTPVKLIGDSNAVRAWVQSGFQTDSYGAGGQYAVLGTSAPLLAISTLADCMYLVTYTNCNATYDISGGQINVPGGGNDLLTVQPGKQVTIKFRGPASFSYIQTLTCTSSGTVAYVARDGITIGSLTSSIKALAVKELDISIDYYTSPIEFRRYVQGLAFAVENSTDHMIERLTQIGVEAKAAEDAARGALESLDKARKECSLTDFSGCTLSQKAANVIIWMLIVVASGTALWFLAKLYFSSRKSGGKFYTALRTVAGAGAANSQFAPTFSTTKTSTEGGSTTQLPLITSVTTAIGAGITASSPHAAAASSIQSVTEVGTPAYALILVVLLCVSCVVVITFLFLKALKKQSQEYEFIVAQIGSAASRQGKEITALLEGKRSKAFVMENEVSGRNFTVKHLKHEDEEPVMSSDEVVYDNMPDLVSCTGISVGRAVPILFALFCFVVPAVASGTHAGVSSDEDVQYKYIALPCNCDAATQDVIMLGVSYIISICVFAYFIFSRMVRFEATHRSSVAELKEEVDCNNAFIGTMFADRQKELEQIAFAKVYSSGLEPPQYVSEPSRWPHEEGSGILIPESVGERVNPAYGPVTSQMFRRFISLQEPDYFGPHFDRCDRARGTAEFQDVCNARDKAIKVANMMMEQLGSLQGGQNLNILERAYKLIASVTPSQAELHAADYRGTNRSTGELFSGGNGIRMKIALDRLEKAIDEAEERKSAESVNGIASVLPEKHASGSASSKRSAETNSTFKSRTVNDLSLLSPIHEDAPPPVGAGLGRRPIGFGALSLMMLSVACFAIPCSAADMGYADPVITPAPFPPYPNASTAPGNSTSAPSSSTTRTFSFTSSFATTSAPGGRAHIPANLSYGYYAESGDVCWGDEDMGQMPQKSYESFIIVLFVIIVHSIGLLASIARLARVHLVSWKDGRVEEMLKKASPKSEAKKGPKSKVICAKCSSVLVDECFPVYVAETVGFWTVMVIPRTHHSDPYIKCSNPKCELAKKAPCSTLVDVKDCDHQVLNFDVNSAKLVTPEVKGPVTLPHLVASTFAGMLRTVDPESVAVAGATHIVFGSKVDVSAIPVNGATMVNFNNPCTPYWMQLYIGLLWFALVVGLLNHAIRFMKGAHGFRYKLALSRPGKGPQVTAFFVLLIQCIFGQGSIGFTATYTDGTSCNLMELGECSTSFTVVAVIIWILFIAAAVSVLCWLIVIAKIALKILRYLKTASHFERLWLTKGEILARAEESKREKDKLFDGK